MNNNLIVSSMSSEWNCDNSGTNCSGPNGDVVTFENFDSTVLTTVVKYTQGICLMIEESGECYPAEYKITLISPNGGEVWPVGSPIGTSNHGLFAGSQSSIKNIDLELGMAHPTVVTLQKYLNSKGYMIETIPGESGSIGYESDYFGEKTKQALMKYQKDKGIYPVWGFYGPQTRRMMGI